MQLKTFETNRLLLRPAIIEDAAFVLELLNTPKWLQFIGDRNVKNLDAAKVYIKNRMLPQYERLGYGNYTVIRKQDAIKIGCCGLYDRDGLDGVDIGFSFLPEYEGQGYGYESAHCIMQAGITQFGLQKIGAITVEENKASQRLIEKLGLVFNKKIRLGDEDEELLYYEFIVS